MTATTTQVCQNQAAPGHTKCEKGATVWGYQEKGEANTMSVEKNWNHLVYFQHTMGRGGEKKEPALDVGGGWQF